MDGNNTAAVGRHWQTQLAIAVAFLKQHNAPIRLEDLAIRSGVEHLLTSPELQQGLRHHERVRFDERTQLVSYKVSVSLSPFTRELPLSNLTRCVKLPPPQPDFVLNSKSDLIVLLRRNAAQGGLPVKKLRESWSGVTTAIEELEREGRVLVTRSGKNLHAPSGGAGGAEGQMKTVFLDDIGRERDPLDQGQSVPPPWCSLLLLSLTGRETLVPTLVLIGYHPGRRLEEDVRS